MDRRAHRDPRPPHRRDGEPRQLSPPRPLGRHWRQPACAPGQIGLIVLATATPDQTFPASATTRPAALGIDDCIAFDVAAVCTGFLYALSVADNMLKGGMADYALVIGAETFSRILDWEDRTTCVLFGDGAGAMVLKAEEGDAEDRHSRHPAPCRRPPQRFALCRRRALDHRTVGKLRMKGKEVFRHAVANLADVMNEALGAAGHAPADVDWVVPHQANKRILDATAKKLGLPPEKVIITVDQHANTSAASVPLALDTAVRDGRIKKGDLWCWRRWAAASPGGPRWSLLSRWPKPGAIERVRSLREEGSRMLRFEVLGGLLRWPT